MHQKNNKEDEVNNKANKIKAAKGIVDLYLSFWEKERRENDPTIDDVMNAIGHSTKPESCFHFVDYTYTQENTYDCGVYVVHYIQDFLNKIYSTLKQDDSETFPEDLFYNKEPLKSFFPIRKLCPIDALYMISFRKAYACFFVPFPY